MLELGSEGTVKLKRTLCQQCGLCGLGGLHDGLVNGREIVNKPNLRMK